MNLISWVGIVLYVGLIGAAVVLGGSFDAFIDYPGLIIVIGGGFGLTLISYTPHEISSSLKFLRQDNLPRRELEQAAYFWLIVARNLLTMGAIGTIIGLIQMMQNLSNPEFIGPSMAAAFLTFFYSLFFSMLFPIPAYFILKKQLTAHPKTENPS